MKKNILYIYLDQPAGNQQLEKVFPKKIKLKKFNIKYISTQKINFTKEEINNYYKNTPTIDRPGSMININSLSKLDNFLKNLNKNDLLFIRERSIINKVRTFAS